MSGPALSSADFRSDVLNTPTPEMWRAMQSAPVGWATFGDDPNVRELERRGAKLLGKEAALFTPTCGMANLTALLTMGERGSQVVLHETAHIATSEAWGISAFGGLVPRLLAGDHGQLDPQHLDDLLAEMEARKQPPASVVCLENTHTNAGGEAIPLGALQAVADAAHRRGARVHLDGARLANAAVALRVPLAAAAAPADTVSFNLNKGLGAPYGALLAGPATLLDAFRLNLKRLGGASVHQAGRFAAAALIALEDTAFDRLMDDHARAAWLAEHFAELPNVQVRPVRIRTNLVLVDLPLDAETVLARLEQEGVRAFRAGPCTVRFAAHRGIADYHLPLAVEALARATQPPARTSPLSIQHPTPPRSSVLSTQSFPPEESLHA